MADNGADKLPVAAVTGTLEEKNNKGDETETRPARAHSPLHDASRGLLPEMAEEEDGPARPRGHSNSDSDSSAVDSDEEEVRVQCRPVVGNWLVVTQRAAFSFVR